MLLSMPKRHDLDRPSSLSRDLRQCRRWVARALVSSSPCAWVSGFWDSGEALHREVRAWRSADSAIRNIYWDMSRDALGWFAQKHDHLQGEKTPLPGFPD
jgi:hypothetical protein